MIDDRDLIARNYTAEGVGGLGGEFFERDEGGRENWFRFPNFDSRNDTKNHFKKGGRISVWKFVMNT